MSTLRRGWLSREIRAHVRLVLVVEVPEERGSGDRGALHPRKAGRIVERVLRQFLDRRHELLEDATRLGEDLAHRLAAIARVEPRVDLVVLVQVGGPLVRGLRLAARHRFEAPDRPSPPGREMSDNVLDRPRTGDARLFHTVLADLREKTLPRLVLGIELGKKISSTHRRPPLISLRLTSSSCVASPAPCAWASLPRRTRPRLEGSRSRRPARPDRSRRSRPREPRLVRRVPFRCGFPAPAFARSPHRRSP